MVHLGANESVKRFNDFYQSSFVQGHTAHQELELAPSHRIDTASAVPVSGDPTPWRRSTLTPYQVGAGPPELFPPIRRPRFIPLQVAVVAAPLHNPCGRY